MARSYKGSAICAMRFTTTFVLPRRALARIQSLANLPQ